MKHLVAGMTLALLGIVVPVHAQSPAECVVPIKALMTASELEATGLRTLSQPQLDALSAWLADYRGRAIALATASNDEHSAAEPMIESRIDGDFDGWVGDTVFKLQNGQIWQQTSPSAKYLFVHAPRVVISGAPHKMRVEGLPTEISVRRLR